MANPRTKARIEARIKERVAYCVEFELNDPRSGFVTITGVEVSNDLGSAKVFYSVYGSEGDKSRVAHMLEDANGFVRRKLGNVLHMRRIPRVVWIYDDSIEYQAQMDKAIQEAMNHDREINPSAHEGIAVEAEEDEEVVLDQEYIDFLNAQEEEGGTSTPETSTPGQ
ncbi:MAG: 30S ribosome-binding factor RbfA [Planctomycetota bacterium]|nr:30S ribosome-binding factor RbfA [Planctomycetota bacterium]